MRHLNWKLTAITSVIFIAAQAAGNQLNDLGVACLLLDGTSINVRSLAITGDRVTGDGVPTGLTLDDLQRIELPDVDDFPSTNATAIVELLGGGRLWATKISLADERPTSSGQAASHSWSLSICSAASVSTSKPTAFILTNLLPRLRPK